MEATPLQIVGCVFCAQSAAERIDEFATLARRERAVVTAKNSRQATFVRFGASDARMIALACRLARAPVGAALRFGFACSTSSRSAPGSDDLRVSSRSIAQATDLAGAARDGEVLLSAQLASLLGNAIAELRSSEVHLPGGRTAVACWLDGTATDAGDEPPPGLLPDSDARHDATLEQAERLDRMTAQAGALAQALEQSQHAVEALEARLSRCHDDQRFLAQRQEAMADLRATVESLLSRVADADGRIAAIESRRPIVEQVQAHAESVTHLLDDIQVNLEMLGEQRAVVDDVGEKLARLDFTLQEAHNTLRALQRERELAERVEHGIKALRASPGKAIAGR